ncbi:AAA family ATPase [Bernardetia sp. OM2101]|uniref:AAA family ATPase n=1 Tax=Bernardetia sp. OM2101 TaxID=3344876 RepID=UPI0035D12038
MKITKIEIQNYRAFYGNDVIETDKKNVLIYGENGSGKSSLYRALEDFFHSANSDYSGKNIDFVSNIFNENEDGKITIHFTGRGSGVSIPLDMGVPFDSSNGFDKVFSNSAPSNGKFIADVGKQNPFFTYKRILRTFLFDKEQEDKVEQILFKLLIEEILGSYELKDKSVIQIGQVWKNLKIDSLEKGAKPQKAFIEWQDLFNNTLTELLKRLSQNTNKFLNDYFSTNLEIELSLAAKFNITDKKSAQEQVKNAKINIEVKLFDKEVPKHHDFLNEARLSALAICMYLASLKIINPPSVLKLLVLDDIFIGLDMSNRIPLLDILKNEFSDYQIFLTTYDRQWFELSKQWFENKTDKEWKFYEMYVDDFSNEGFEVPKIEQSKSEIAKALFYKNKFDYSASANYLRKAVESLISRKFKKSELEEIALRGIALKGEDGMDKQMLDRQIKSIFSFWEKINYENINYENSNPVYHNAFKEISVYVQHLMNPLSHVDISVPAFKEELTKVITNLEILEQLPSFQGAKIILKKNDEVILKIRVSEEINNIYLFKSNENVFSIKLGENIYISDSRISSLKCWEEKPKSLEDIKKIDFLRYKDITFSNVLEKIIEYENKSKKEADLLPIPNWQDIFFKYEEDNATQKSLNQLAL